ncbi:hypothetical protein BCF33_2703 [Hasllibacter halocynthiae]|uniref:PadR family transcriptional regulator n=1 Tax=Hasllibacter halocynthiae TaxID=595589 RepID=A0A2T0WZ98_9RHOB|nr:hypothetical protein [Hasllibacter halocynthiae]PRY92010.1 hypothetical protein BCF33_2703 [Hasllibacter halocynthiae]
MTTILVVLLLFFLMAALVTGLLRRWDRREGYDQEDKPFHATPRALAEQGLLFEERFRRGQGQSVFAVTPAGEAELRSWLRNPSNDPGLLEGLFGQIGVPEDRVVVARRRIDVHAERLAEYERVVELLGDHPEWRYALEAARMGVRFERHCLAFWQDAAKAVLPPPALAPEPPLTFKGAAE